MSYKTCITIETILFFPNSAIKPYKWLLCPWVFQEIVLEWIAILFSRGSSGPRDWTQVSHIVDRHFTVWATREVHQRIVQVINFFSSHFLSSWVYMKSFISWLLEELSNCNPHFFFVYSNTCNFSNLEYRYNVYFPLMESENIIVQFVSYHKLLYAHEISNHIKKRTLLMLIMSPLR